MAISVAALTILVCAHYVADGRDPYQSLAMQSVSTSVADAAVLTEQSQEPSSRGGRDQDTAQNLPSDSAPLLPDPAAAGPTPDNASDRDTPSPASPAPLQPVRYQVVAGDTVSSLARKFGVSPDTVRWANKLGTGNLLVPGQRLLLPPVSGAVHEVRESDTIASIAQSYLTDVAAIARANAISPATELKTGHLLIVPSAAVRLPAVDPAVGKAASTVPAAAPSSPASAENGSPLSAPLGRVPIAVPPAADINSAAPPRIAASSAPSPVTLPSPVPSGPSNPDGSAPAINNPSQRQAPNTVDPTPAIDGNAAHWAFIQASIVPAQQSQREIGVPASVTIAQAIHESAWGTSQLSRQANNYFGIKASAKPGTRGTVEMTTGERVGGANVTVKDSFRAYSTMAESFADHGRFFADNTRYAKAMASSNDPKAFIRLVAAAGYATDPDYSRKVLAYMDKYDLYRFDLN